MTKMYTGEAILKTPYTVAAEDVSEAKEFIAELAEEDFPDTDVDTVINVLEVK